MKSHRNPSRPLGVGIQLPEVERVVRWPEIKAMAVLAEQVGFDSLWLGNHLLYRQASGEVLGPWETWTSLASLATVTDKVFIGPLVAATSFHHPTMLAKMASTIDDISDGRLIVGLGAGWNETEYRAFGFPYDHRVSRFEEAFTIIRRLLAQEVVDFQGLYYQIEHCELQPRRARPGSPPLMVGSVGSRMLRATLPYVQLWNAWFNAFGNTPDGVKPLLEKVNRECEALGRNPAEVSRTVALLVQAPGGTGRQAGEPENPEIIPISGEPGAVADRLSAFAASGIDHVQLVLDPITLGSIEWCAAIIETLDAG